MNNFQKINNEILEKVLKSMQSKEIQEVIAKTKAATDSGTFEVIISTADQDRQGEVIDQKGWDFTNYKNNPVVLWGHNYYELPIGVTDEIYTNDKGQTIAKGRFAPEEANPFAQQVRRLYDAKIVKTTSVGFIAREMEGNVITKAELLEFSFVPVPANPMALSLAKELNLNASELMTKGLFVKADPEEQADQEMIQKVGAELAAIQSETDTSIIAHSKAIIQIITAEEDTDENEKAENTARVRQLMSRTKIKIAINGMKATIAALEEILDSSEGKEHLDGDALKKRSNTAELADLVESLKKFNDNQQVLRIINTLTIESLTKINEKSRKK